MYLQEYLDQGGTREDKLVVVYKQAPEKLSEDYRAIFTLLDSDNSNVAISAQTTFVHLWEAFQRYEPVELEQEDE